MDKKNIKFEVAPQIAVDQYSEIAYDLLKRVFGIEEAFISDESDLNDFYFDKDEENRKRKMEEFLKKIEELYGVDVSDVPYLNLAVACQRIIILGNVQ